MLRESSESVSLSIRTQPPLPRCYFLSSPPPQIDTSESELPEEKATDRSYSQMEDDTFQASMTALHGSVCSLDLEYLDSSTPKVSPGHSAPCWRNLVKNKEANLI